MNADVASNAAIAYSKLNLTGNVVDGDISSSAAIAATKISGTAAVLNGTQTFTGTNTLNNELIGKQITTPANPSAGYDKLYFKSDDKLYRLTSGGTESTVGQNVTLYSAGGAGGNTTSSSYVDVTNSSITLTTTATANVLINVALQWQNTTVSNNNFRIVRGVTAIGQAMNFDTIVSTDNTSAHLTAVDASLAAGTYTYKVQMNTSANTLTVGTVAITIMVVQ